MTRRAMVILLAVGLIVAGVAWGFRGERSARLVLATNFVETGTVAVRVDRFEQAWEGPGQEWPIPPKWIRRNLVLVNAWFRLFRKPERVPDGLVWYLVDATVVSNQQLQLDDLRFRLDYGSYTLGSNGRGLRNEGGPTYAVSTRFEVTDGPVPQALEIQVKGEWLRFPIDSR